MKEPIDEEERLARWRLVLGKAAEPSLGSLRGPQAAMDKALEPLYGDGPKLGSRAGSSPYAARWLGEIRAAFPRSTVRVMQQDAMERLGLKQLLLEPEVLENVEPDVNLLATLVGLSKVIPERSKATARAVVQKIADDLIRRLAGPTREAVRGAIDRSTRNRRPRLREIDWNRTIRCNLRNWLPDQRTLVPERLVGFGHRRSGLKEVVLVIDQSGSMMTSVVYSAIFGSVLASIPALTTRVVVYDTEVVDLSEKLSDPVDLLFGTQLGGGTDTSRALAYVGPLVTRPRDAVVILITDLYDCDPPKMLRQCQDMVESGVNLVCLTALTDQGNPGFSEENAARMASLGVPTFACTPDLFPELMAAALGRRDLGLWAARRGIAAARG